MLDPSSSEEEGDEIQEVARKEVAAPKSAGGARLSPGRASDGGAGLQPRGAVRPSSPSPSVGSDKEKEDLEKMQREEEERKKRLQLYVFVMRCIAYPFNAKQPTDMARRQQKVRSVWYTGNNPDLTSKLFVNILHLSCVEGFSNIHDNCCFCRRNMCLYGGIFKNAKYNSVY